MIPSKNPYQAMISMLRANPAIADNPQARAYLDVLERNDSAEGEKLANNLLETYKMTKDEALKKAMAFFHIR